MDKDNVIKRLKDIVVVHETYKECKTKKSIKKGCVLGCCMLIKFNKDEETNVEVTWNANE